MIIFFKSPDNSEVPVPWLLPPNFSKVLPIFFCAHALGLFAYYLPKFGALFGAMFEIGPEESIPIRYNTTDV